MPRKAENILEARIAFPEEVYIVGTAPEGDEVYRAISAGAFIIAVNGAVDCTLPCDPAIWMMSDPNVLQRKYFRRNIEHIRTSGYDIYPSGIQAGGPTVPVVDERTIWPHHQWIKTIYRNRRDKGLQEAGPFLKSHGTLRAGATIAGAAIQLAFYMGARIIRLVGIRMHGDEYFDGSRHDDGDRADKDWPGADIFEWLLHIMRDVEGVRITYLRDDLNAGVELEKPHDGRMLFESGLKVPSRVVILAPGPRGEAHWGKIRQGDCVIAVNGAIDIQSIKPLMWICADGHTTERDYFRRGCERCEREGILKVWSGAVRERAGDFLPDLNFRMCPTWDKGFRYVPEKVRPDATVVGIAIDIAYRLGAKYIDLCGADMSGDKYFDDSPAPANVDDSHGIIWDSRGELDDEIRWMHAHGVRVSTMSETMLKEPHAWLRLDQPSVAMLTMAFDPVHTKAAVFCAAIQDYPDELKALYLLTQNGTQPPIEHDLPFKLVQSDVEGEWPELWIRKLMRFFELADEDYVAIFDEDDYFEPDYLTRAIRALREQKKRMVWTFQNRMVTRFQVKDGRYRSAFGAIVIERELAFEVARALWRQLYGEDWEPGKGAEFTYGLRGAQDMNYQHMLIARLEKVQVQSNAEFVRGENIGIHDGKRWYRYHLNANTCSGRKDEECIDYWRPGLWYEGTRFAEARWERREKEG